jgi:hypothetical protein
MSELKPFARLSIDRPKLEWMTYSQDEFDCTLRTIQSSHPGVSVLIEWPKAILGGIRDGDGPFRADPRDIERVLASMEMPGLVVRVAGWSSNFEVYMELKRSPAACSPREYFSLDDLRELENKLLSMDKNVVSAHIIVNSWIVGSITTTHVKGLILKLELGYAS